METNSTPTERRLVFPDDWEDVTEQEFGVITVIVGDIKPVPRPTARKEDRMKRKHKRGVDETPATFAELKPPGYWNGERLVAVRMMTPEQAAERFASRAASGRSPNGFGRWQRSIKTVKIETRLSIASAKARG